MLDSSIEEIERRGPGTIAIVDVRRGGEVIDMDYEARLQVGDEILVIGQIDHLLQQAGSVGEEIADNEGLSLAMSSLQVVVSNPDIIGKSVSDIRPAKRIGALPIRVRRLREELPMTSDMVLKRGDVITFFGPDIAVDRLVDQVGHVERDVVGYRARNPGGHDWRRAYRTGHGRRAADHRFAYRLPALDFSRVRPRSLSVPLGIDGTGPVNVHGRRRTKCRRRHRRDH
jgi:hypothetical protein